MMRNRDRKTGMISDQDEFDIDNIDQVVFDDPVLLLDYLEKLESKKKEESVLATKKTNTYQDNYQPSIKNAQSYQHAMSHRACYGYDPIGGKLKINQEEAASIIAIIDLYDAGYSITQIADKLRLANHRTVTGKKFYPAAVQAIIDRRELYEGKTGYPVILKTRNKKAETENINVANYPDEVKKNKAISQSSVLREDQTRHKKIYTSSKTKNHYEIPKDSIIQKMDDHKVIYHNIDDFLTFIRSRGIPIIDNRWKDGCVWVRDDHGIADIMAKAVIKGRGFRYTAKCKAFNGEPGWYY